MSRDLIVVTKQSELHPDLLQKEIEWLNDLLNEVEAMSEFCIANELIDVNNLKIISKPEKIERFIRMKLDKPFVFIFNKN